MVRPNLGAGPRSRHSATKSGGPLPPKGGVGGPPSDGGAPSVSSITQQALGLSASERKKLVDQLLALQLDEAPSKDSALWAQAVKTAIDDVLGVGMGVAFAPASLKKALGARSSWDAVCTVLTAAKLDKASPADKLSAYQLLAGLLLQHCREVSRATGAPISPNFIGTCSSQMPAIFDLAFPGYLQSGLAFVPFSRRRAGAQHVQR